MSCVVPFIVLILLSSINGKIRKLCIFAKKYHLTVFPIPKWVTNKLNKISRGLIWKGDDAENASGGHSLVNWSTVCKPRDLGGLRVMDLMKFGRALRLRWPWFQWTDLDRSWSSTQLPCDATDMELFRAFAVVTIGDGAKTMFWHDNWLQGGALNHKFPG